jgi:hypothetical protein
MTDSTGNTGEPVGEGGGVFETIRHIDSEGGEWRRVLERP